MALAPMRVFYRARSKLAWQLPSPFKRFFDAEAVSSG
jgi:hypothetical protein